MIKKSSGVREGIILDRIAARCSVPERFARTQKLWSKGTRSGHVRLYEYASSCGWLRLGDDIDGASVWDFSGVSVSLSSDGKTVAIGAESNGNYNQGHVRVYEYNAWSRCRFCYSNSNEIEAKKIFGLLAGPRATTTILRINNITTLGSFLSE
jgi:hypothetical protein